MCRRIIQLRDDQSVVEKMLGLDSDQGSQSPTGKPWLTGFLLPLGSGLIAALAFLTQNTQLPGWATVLVSLYLVVVAGVALYIPVRWLFAFVSDNLRLASLARRALPQIVESVRRLRKLVAHGQANTAIYVFQEAGQWDEIRSHRPPLDAEHLETIRDWLFSIERSVRHPKRGEFGNLCSELSTLIQRYNRLCVQGLKRLEEVIAEGRLQEQRLRYLRQQWNVHREGHVAFMREWADLSKTINEKAGARLCVDYYEPLGTLE